MEFISNSWFISIIGGLCVTLTWEIIKLLMERKAYNRQIKLVQNDFSLIIKSIIGEDDLPNTKILESLLKGIAKKHNVKYKDVSTVDYIFYMLISEVMESNFLDYNQKVMFCEKLETLSVALSNQIQSNNNLTIIKNRDYIQYRLIQLIPVLIFSSGSIGTTLYVMRTNENFKELDKRFTEYFFDKPLLIIGFFFITFIIVIYFIYRIYTINTKEQLIENGNIPLQEEAKSKKSH